LQVFVNPKDSNNRDITWHNSVALEGYVKRLGAVAVSASPAQCSAETDLVCMLAAALP